MKYGKFAVGLAVLISLALGPHLALAGQSGTCTIGGEVGPGVQVRLAANQGDSKPAPPAVDKKPAETGQPDPAKPQDTAKDKKTEPAKPAGAPPVPVIPPDEGC